MICFGYVSSGGCGGIGPANVRVVATSFGGDRSWMVLPRHAQFMEARSYSEDKEYLSEPYSYHEEEFGCVWEIMTFVDERRRRWLGASEKDPVTGKAFSHG